MSAESRYALRNAFLANSRELTRAAKEKPDLADVLPSNDDFSGRSRSSPEKKKTPLGNARKARIVRVHSGMQNYATSGRDAASPATTFV